MDMDWDEVEVSEAIATSLQGGTPSPSSSSATEEIEVGRKASSAAKRVRSNNIPTKSPGHGVCVASNLMMHVGDIPAQDAVLGMDHLLEMIFFYMDLDTLKTSRLACLRWKKFGAVELRKQSSITLVFVHSMAGVTNMEDRRRNATEPELPEVRMSTHRILPLGLVADPEETLNDLKNLILRSPEEFPCETFYIICSNLNFVPLRILLSSVGLHIKHLMLMLGQGSVVSLEEWVVVTQNLRSLLLEQVQNLESLYLCSVSDYVEVISNFDRDPQEIFFPPRIPPLLLPRLEKFSVEGCISTKVFNDIMDAAINLQAFSGQDFGVSIKYFVEGNGKNRIGLLKGLTFTQPTEENIALAQKLLNNKNRDTFKLERIVIYPFRNLSLEFLVQQCNATIWFRYTQIINQILELCSDTLIDLTVNPFRFLIPLKIPRLPKVTRLCLLDWDSVKFQNVSTTHFFPTGFSISDKLPILRKIDIAGTVNGHFCQRLDISVPVLSVKRINFASASESGRQGLMRMFPNATINPRHSGIVVDLQEE